MDTDGERRDTWQSIVLIAAAIGLVAGLRLTTYDTLSYDGAITAMGVGITVLSVLAVFVRRRWVGGTMVALALATVFLLLASSFFTVQAVVAAAFAAAAGMVVLAAPRAAELVRSR